MELQAVQSKKKKKSKELRWKYCTSQSNTGSLNNCAVESGNKALVFQLKPAQHDWQDIISCAVEKKAIPLLWFLRFFFGFFFLWNCGPSLEYRSK